MVPWVRLQCVIAAFPGHTRVCFVGKSQNMHHKKSVDLKDNIGITHVFHALTFAGSRGSCLNTRPLGRVFKHPPRDPAGVYAMKQKCVIVILAYLTGFQHKPR